MEIVHICLAAAYVEGFGYQENILPRKHAEMGHIVTVITSEYEFNSKYKKTKREKMDYINKYGIHVIALPKSSRYGYYSRFGDFDGVYEKLSQIRPDIIFVHGGQFVALMDIIKYCKKNKNTKLYIDQHGDYYNMPLNSWKLQILQRIIFGHQMRRAVKYCSKFWGVTPWRCQYLRDVYGIPQSKIELLVMGGDDDCIHFDQMPQLRNQIRDKLNIQHDDFAIVTGGKIDKTKNIHLLIQAVSEINRDNVKLIVFGQPDDEIEEKIERSCRDKHIRNIGWIDSSEVYNYFLASDLVIFPGTHSVLWEQAAACGIPMFVKDWEGMHHIDAGGNCEFLTEDSSEEIRKKIIEIIDTPEKYEKIKSAAIEKAIPIFSYNEIAKRAIELK